MKLWTAWADYFATGEGMTYMAVITYADNEEVAKEKFKERFGEYMTIGCDVKEGVIRNHVTEKLFSDWLLNKLPTQEGRAEVMLFAEYHFNLS